MMDMDDYGVCYLIETLHQKGPLSLEDLKLDASKNFQDGEWNDYLQACFEFLKFKKQMLPLGAVGSLWTISEEVRSKPPAKLLDPNKEYYCSRCFLIERKLVFMKALKDDGAGIHMCPDCGGVGKENWIAILATCDTFIHHYRKLKDQVEIELDEE